MAMYEQRLGRSSYTLFCLSELLQKSSSWTNDWSWNPKHILGHSQDWFILFSRAYVCACHRLSFQVPWHMPLAGHISSHNNYNHKRKQRQAQVWDRGRTSREIWRTRPQVAEDCVGCQKSPETLQIHHWRGAWENIHVKSNIFPSNEDPKQEGECHMNHPVMEDLCIQQMSKISHSQHRSRKMIQLCMLRNWMQLCQKLKQLLQDNQWMPSAVPWLYLSDFVAIIIEMGMWHRSW